ncbi:MULTISPECIES: S41 family peptidase [Thalassotalea]|uniref:S41 family peptidase n=1 Tax=Thalassotalea castellviae TaxID=3075612 RepID=A0ABU3A1L3_9GAMM|nr:S41 family peptidase [Thalassotalea sp. W431]MDT0604059.1 S41 family peptidase [Thalassotalea sp. W431]
MFLNDFILRSLLASSVLVLTACGGSGSSNGSSAFGGNGSGNSTSTPTWVAGEFTAHAQLANQCAAGSGSAMTEKLWLRSYSNDTYLWYDEILDQDPAPFTVLEYFDELVTTAVTPSGKLKDQFHFSMSSEEWENLSTSGSSVGFGFNISIEQGVDIERKITITYSDPNTPAANANVERGAIIVEVDGVNVASANDSASIDTLNHGLFPSEDGQESVFLIHDLESEEPREVMLTAQTIISDPVPMTKVIETDINTVGYMVFNDHIATAEKGLYDAISTLKAANVDELVIDFRYNGGGYLALASQLGYMVAGNQTVNRTFEQTIFNDKYPNTNPVTGNSLSPTPFYQETIGFNADYIREGIELPTLNLSRVFVLTSAGTCSASEAFINGVRGIGVEVIQIGTTTCGKPYGFYPTDNCDTTYFTVQFKGVNDQGFGDYADGFSPSDAPIYDTDIQGCDVADDLTKPLGDQQEGMLSTAMYYLENGQCPELVDTEVTSKTAVKQVIDYQFSIEDKRVRSQFSRNRILLNK